jgi:hypothetical protein
MALKQEKKFEKCSDSWARTYIDTKDYISTVRGNINVDDADAEKVLYQKLKIQGTCQELEKPYFRLTEIPDPANVRPESVLKKAFKLIQKRYRHKEVDDRWILDQMNSIRLDMKIQRIQNSFTTEVYEKNARLCLEIGDMQQYKVCQGQLIDMYREGLAGKKYEFYMYRIVYLALNSEKFE